MIEIGKINEHEMVSAFLKAEIDSPRFGKCIIQKLTLTNYTRRKIIDNPNLKKSDHNDLRVELLSQCRGYGRDQLLFRGFPKDTNWKKVRIGPTEIELLKYAKFDDWVKLSNGSRLVLDGAKNVDKIDVMGNDGVLINTRIKTVVADLRGGKRYPELIAVKNHEEFLVLLEGHMRATAYALFGIKEDIEIIVGSSTSMHEWAFY